MPWVRVSDDFYDHPKFAALTPIAVGLWVTALAWSNRNLADGRIPRPVVQRLVDLRGVALFDRDPDSDSREAYWIDVAEELVKAGLWVEEDEAYTIHDYGDYQPSKEDVLKERDAARARMRELRAKRSQTSPEVPEGSEDVQENFEEGSLTPNPVPNPNPVPEKQDQTLRRKRRATSLPDDWEPDEELRDWIGENYPSVNARLETQKFKNHAQANGRAQKDWRAAWRNWIINAATRYGPSSNGRDEAKPQYRPASEVFGE